LEIADDRVNTKRLVENSKAWKSKKELYSRLKACVGFLAGWAEENCVLFNVKKCEVLPHCVIGNSRLLHHDHRIPVKRHVTYFGVKFNETQASRLPWNLTHLLKDLGHEIRPRSAMFHYLRTQLFKLSLQILRMLFLRWILSKITFSDSILAHCKTHDEEYKISFWASLRNLSGLHKSRPNSVLYDASDSTLYSKNGIHEQELPQDPSLHWINLILLHGYSLTALNRTTNTLVKLHHF